MYFGFAETIWRTTSFTYNQATSYDSTVGYELIASPQTNNFPASISVAQLAVQGLSDILFSTRNIPDPTRWDVYEQTYTKNESPLTPWFKFIPINSMNAEPKTNGNIAPNELGIANLDTTLQVEGGNLTIPNPTIPLPLLNCKITELGKDYTVDPRVAVLLLSIAISQLPFAHRVNEQIGRHGFGPGKVFEQYLPTHSAYIRIEALTDYAGTADEITFLHISYALRQLARYGANTNYYGGVVIEWHLKDKEPFLKMTLARRTNDEGQTPNLGDANIFQELAQQSFDDQPDTAATVSPS